MIINTKRPRQASKNRLTRIDIMGDEKVLINFIFKGKLMFTDELQSSFVMIEYRNGQYSLSTEKEHPSFEKEIIDVGYGSKNSWAYVSRTRKKYYNLRPIAFTKRSKYSKLVYKIYSSLDDKYIHYHKINNIEIIDGDKLTNIVNRQEFKRPMVVIINVYIDNENLVVKIPKKYITTKAKIIKRAEGFVSNKSKGLATTQFYSERKYRPSIVFKPFILNA